MSRRLSGDSKIDSPDGSIIRFNAGYSVSGSINSEKHFFHTCSNTDLSWKVKESKRVHDGTLFNNAGFTDSVTVFTQPADSILWGVKIRLDIRFAAAGMTDLDVTVGDGGDNTGILNPAAMNLTSDAATTEYKDRGAYWNTIGGYYAASATNWVAYATAVGANLDTTTAGQITLYFIYLEI